MRLAVLCFACATALCAQSPAPSKDAVRGTLNDGLVGRPAPSATVRPPRVTPPDARTPLVVCMTDYGNHDFYVGALHGSIMSMCGSTRIDTITNEVPEFDVHEGAYTLLQASREYPTGTIFVASVDPGVGTSRQAIAVRTKRGYYFVGPDNGILTLVMDEFGVDWVRAITNRAVMRQAGISKTFHGRDVFGPAAASLACGVPPDRFGPLMTATVRLPITPLTVTPDRISGCVLAVDHYGNLITNVPEAAVVKAGLKPGQTLAVTLGDRKMDIPFVSTYAEVPQGKPLALIASAGYVELAVNMGNMASLAGASRNTAVAIAVASMNVK